MKAQQTPRANRRKAIISQRPMLGLLLLLLMVGGYRLTLIDRGHFYDFDECYYLQMTDMIDALSDGQYRAAAQHLFIARGATRLARPG